MNQEHYSILEQEKLKFGIQIILSEFYKLILIYSIAFLLDCAVPTLIVHSTFFLLRQVCLGYHFKNLYVCLILSTLAFPISANYLADLTINFSTFYLYLGAVLLLLLIYTLAPKGTVNQPIINQRHQIYLRKKIKVRLLLLVIVLCLSPQIIQTLIIYGVFLEVIMLIIQSIKGAFLLEDFSGA